MFKSERVFDFFFQEIQFTQQPKTGLISRFYRQVENRLNKFKSQSFIDKHLIKSKEFLFQNAGNLIRTSSGNFLGPSDSI